MTTVAGWLATRTPVPPPALAARMRELVGEAGLRRDAAEAADILAHAGEAVLAQLLLAQATTRDSALDLLVADALVTYAFEAAADQPATLERRATDAMARIARVPHDQARA